MKTYTILTLLFIFLGLFKLSAQSAPGSGVPYLLLDDFTGSLSKLGTEWEGFTDQVMGGISEISVSRIPDPSAPYIRMQGRVSLERNGGFIQVRLMLVRGSKAFDGTPYKGIRLTVRGRDSGYYIFLRTTSTLLPWKYYAAPVPVSEDWSIVEIPWSTFGPGDYGRMQPLKVNSLKSIALTAYGKEFNAQIDLKEIGLY